MKHLKRLLRKKAVLAFALGGLVLLNFGAMAPHAFAGGAIINPGHLLQDDDGIWYCVCGWTPTNCGYCANG